LLYTGLTNIYNKLNPKALRTKIPFGLDMALKAQTLMNKEHRFEPQHNVVIASLLRDRIYLAMAVGIFFMLRKSEHMTNNGDETTLLRGNIIFYYLNNEIIPYNLVGNSGHQAHRVFLLIKYSKKDQHGYGRRLVHIRQPTTAGSSCIVQLLEIWIKQTRDRYEALPSHHLYFVPDKRVPLLLPAEVVSEMRNTTASLGVSTKSQTSTHSLRYGGATMMAAAGFPQYLIAHYGGWSENSQSLKLYTKLPLEAIERVSSQFSNAAQSNCSEAFMKDCMVMKKAYNKK
jgi:hypothetical protein